MIGIVEKYFLNVLLSGGKKTRALVFPLYLQWKTGTNECTIMNVMNVPKLKEYITLGSKKTMPRYFLNDLLSGAAKRQERWFFLCICNGIKEDRYKWMHNNECTVMNVPSLKEYTWLQKSNAKILHHCRKCHNSSSPSFKIYTTKHLLNEISTACSPTINSFLYRYT